MIDLYETFALQALPVQLLDVMVPPTLLPIHLLIHHVQGDACQLTQLVCGQQFSYGL